MRPARCSSSKWWSNSSPTAGTWPGQRGAPTGLAPAVAEETLAAARRIYGAAPRTEGGSFAPERPAPPGAHATDRLAAFLGRDPVVPGRTPA